MDKIIWCKSKGMLLVEPNQNLADMYILKAEEALSSLRINVIKDWKITTGYYALYYSLYAILTKIGVKCEMHSCTIEFAKRYLVDFLTAEDIQFIEKALKARIDSQYYVDRTIPDALYERILRDTPMFLLRCKSMLVKLDEKKINHIRQDFML